MSSVNNDQKRRPTPVEIPPVPRHLPAAQAAHPPRTSSRQQYQQLQIVEDRNASGSTHRGARSATTPLTSPLEHDESRLPFPQSGSHKSRASAVTALASLFEESRDKSAASTTRSRQSERSHQSAVAAQAKLEALNGDERTSRAKIEARSEVNLFKMTGQVPPTPLLSECFSNAFGKQSD